MISTLKLITKQLDALGQTIKKSSFLTGTEWVSPDPVSGFHKMIFEKDNSLFVAIGANVEKGEWKLLAGGKTLYVRLGKEEKLFKPIGLDDKVLVLKTDNPFSNEVSLSWFVDQELINKADPMKFLSNILSDQLGVYTTKLDDGRILASFYTLGTKSIIGRKAVIDGKPPKDGVFQSADKKHTFHIKNNTIAKVEEH